MRNSLVGHCFKKGQSRLLGILNLAYFQHKGEQDSRLETQTGHKTFEKIDMIRRVKQPGLIQMNKNNQNFSLTQTWRNGTQASDWTLFCCEFDFAPFFFLKTEPN